MKKNLFYLFALICSMSLFTACSDDDEDTAWKKLPSQAITAENLTLTTNAQNFPTASVKLTMIDAQNGVLTLNNAIRGLNEVEVNITVAEQADGSFKFQGEKNIGTVAKAVADLVSSTTVKISGSITLDGKAEVAVVTAASGSMVKKWQLCDNFISDPDAGYANAPFKMQWVSPYGEGDNAGIAAGNIQLIATPVLSSIIVKLLKDVEFKADGSIVANYAKEIAIDLDEIMSGMGGANLPSTDGVTWLTSPANLAYWYAGGNHVYVVLDIPAIVASAMAGQENPDMSPEAISGILEMLKGMSGAEIKGLLGEFLKSVGSDNILSKLDLTKISDTDIEKLIGYVINGFPLNCQMSEVVLKDGSKINSIYVYLDKSIFDTFMPLVYPLLPDLDKMVKELVIDMFGQPMPIWGLISALTGLQSLTELEPLWKATTRFNIGLDLGTGSYKVAK